MIKSYNYIKKIYYRLLNAKKKLYLEDLQRKGLKLGTNVGFVDTFFIDPSHCFLVEIGDNCVICPNVRFIAHDASIKHLVGYTKIGKITIRDSCFIGDSSIILPNVSIGPKSIVGAGSVVTKDIPPNSVAAGNPASVLCSIEEYLQKIERLGLGKKVFSREYHIDNINEERKNEILEYVSHGISFIK